MADMNEKRLQFAKDWVPGGCKTFVAGKESGPDAAKRLKDENPELGVEGATGGRGADVVIEATGAAPCTQAGVHVVRPGGTFVQVGMGKDELTFPIGAVCGSEVTFKGSFRYKQGDYAVAVGMIARGVMDADRLVSGKVKFEDAEEAFGKTKKGEGIKTLISGPA
jgi:D-xylulose reductase